MNERREVDDAPVHGRLRVELRILGLVACLGLIHAALGAVWLEISLDGEQLRALFAPPVVLRLSAALLVATIMTLGHVAASMPATRWTRPSIVGPHPWPLALAGFPSLLAWPWLIARDRRARTQAPDAENVELAFRQLLALPRRSASIFAFWLGSGTVVAITNIATSAALDSRTLVLLTALWLSSLLPLVSLAPSRIRRILVPEFLSAPRPSPTALPDRQSLRLRLGGPAALALIAAVAVPAFCGVLWFERLSDGTAEAKVQGEAAALLDLADTGDRATLGAHLATNPRAGLLLAGERYGRVPTTLGQPETTLGQPGFVDLDHDKQKDHWLAPHPESPSQVLAIVQLPSTTPIPTALLAAILTLGLATGLFSLVLLLRDVERDVLRANRQVEAVAEGQIPEPMAVESFATRELRELIAAVDRLVGRITNANVTKYVLIEKGQEADRLKSQFLANMSHDLRSPLNSVIGFSELLQTGIEGELADDQLEMVRAIHSAGRNLLAQIDDILDTAKLEAGHMELHREPTPPATLLSRAIQRARARLPQLEFETATAPGLPPAFVDPYRTVQAVENALVFAGEGLERARIAIACNARREADGPGEIILTITTPRALASGEALEQAQRGFVRVPGQTGLGLSLPIATSIVELQGGKLRVLPHDEDGPHNLRIELRLPAIAPRRRGPRLRARSR